MTDLKLKDLRYLVAVADTRHFGRAAAKCFVSQPTLSAQLRKLEEYLGVQLIERRPRRVTLTAAGEEIAQRARTMLESGDAIVALAQTRRDPLAGQLRLALLPTIGPYLLPLVALKLRKALPRLELMLYEYQTEPMLERLHNGDIDVGILALPVHDEGWRTRELYQEPFVLGTAGAHPLGGARAGAHRGPAGRDAAAARGRPLPARSGAGGLRRSGVHEKQDFRATSIETLRQMVAAGAGVTLLPALASRGAYGAAKGVAVRPFARPVPSRRIGAVWRKSSARAAAIDGGLRPDRAPQRTVRGGAR